MTPLADHLDKLGVHHTARHLDDILALATKRRLGPTEILEHIVEFEQQARAARSLKDPHQEEPAGPLQAHRRLRLDLAQAHRPPRTCAYFFTGQ